MIICQPSILITFGCLSTMQRNVCRESQSLVTSRSALSNSPLPVSNNEQPSSTDLDFRMLGLRLTWCRGRNTLDPCPLRF